MSRGNRPVALTLQGLKLPLIGEHQLINAMTSIAAITTLQELGFEISTDAVYKGLRDIHWPCRFEICKKDPLVILDGAHDQKSATVVVNTIKKILPSPDRPMILSSTQ